MQDGRGSAVAGIVLGWIGIGFSALFIILIVLLAALDPTALDEASATISALSS